MLDEGTLWSENQRARTGSIMFEKSSELSFFFSSLVKKVYRDAQRVNLKMTVNVTTAKGLTHGWG